MRHNDGGGLVQLVAAEGDAAVAPGATFTLPVPTVPPGTVAREVLFEVETTYLTAAGAVVHDLAHRTEVVRLVGGDSRREIVTGERFLVGEGFVFGAPTIVVPTSPAAAIASVWCKGRTLVRCDPIGETV